MKCYECETEIETGYYYECMQHNTTICSACMLKSPNHTTKRFGCRKRRFLPIFNHKAHPDMKICVFKKVLVNQVDSK